MQNFFVEFVTFLAQSSDCDSHNITWREKKNCGLTEFGHDIDQNEKKKMHENWSENPQEQLWNEGNGQ